MIYFNRNCVMAEQALPWWGALVGALVVSWMIFQSQGVINIDGILYIEIAKQFAAGEWRQGLALYNWPFYPLLIAATHSISGFGLQTSAHLLTVLFFASSVAGMMVLTRIAGGNRVTMLAAALLTLSSPYLIRSLLPMVIRDHGFWAAHIWSLVFFLRYYHNNTWRCAIVWGIAAVTATLFRIEGIVYLAMLPLTILMKNTESWHPRLSQTLKAYALPAAIFMVILMAMLLNRNFDAYHLGRLHDPANITSSVFSQLTHGLSAKSEIYAEQILGSFLKDFAMAGILLTLAFVLLIKSAGSAGWLPLLFAIGLLTRNDNKGVLLPQHTGIFAWLLVLGLLNGLFILLSAFVLSQRYLLPIAVVVLIFGAFGMAALIASWKSTTKTSPFGTLYPWIIIATLLATLSVLWPKHDGNRYEIEAVQWIKSHVPAGSRVYYDHGRLRYYATGDSFSRIITPWEEVQTLISSGELRKYDYVSVHVSHKHPEQRALLNEKLNSSPVATFESRRNQAVLIYKISNR